MLTTVCSPAIDRGALSVKVEAWRATTGAKRAPWDDPFAARLRSLPGTVSVWKAPDGDLWCARAAGSEDLNEQAVREGALTGDWTCQGPVPLGEVPDLVLTGLCLGALASHEGPLLGTYSEFQGHLLSLDAARHANKKEAHGLLWDVVEEPGLGYVLTFRMVSFLPCSKAKFSGRRKARAWAARPPKERGAFPLPLYDLSKDGHVARHVRPEAVPKGLWFQGAQSGRRYPKMPFFSNNAGGWESSKCHALLLLLRDVDRAWGGAFSLGLRDMGEVCGPALPNVTSLQVAERVMGGGQVRVRAHKEVDAGAFPGALEAVRRGLEQCGCQVVDAGASVPEVLVIHERDWQMRTGADPHDRRRSHPVQCLTIESLWTAINAKSPEAAVNALVRSCAKELAVKRGVANGTAAGVAPAGTAGWSALAPLPKADDAEGEPAWAFCDVDADMGLSFETEDDALDLFAMNGPKEEMGDAATGPDGSHLPVSYVLRDPEGNVCRAEATCAYALPDLEEAERMAREAPNGRMARSVEARGSYAAVLDCHWMPLGDGAALYWSGVHGAGMKTRALRGAPLRVLKAAEGSSLPDPQAFLSLLSVDFVRLAEPSVRPWQLKFLDEWGRAEGLC